MGQEGNQFWRLARRPGRPRLFDTADQLWDLCEEYFKYMDENPMQEEKTFCNKDGVQVHQSPRLRPYTLGSLCLFLGMTKETWGQYRKKEEFSDLCTYVEGLIYEQKFAGASADMLNANIIARDLGLRDRKEHEVAFSLEDLILRSNEKS